MNKKVLFVVALILLICVLSFWKIIDLQNEVARNEYLKNDLLTDNLTTLSEKLLFTSETLKMYDENFNDMERELFEDSLAKDAFTLNQMGHRMNTLVQQDKQLLIYEEGIWKIENIIEDIEKGTITKEEMVKDIAEVMEGHSQEMSDLFYKENIGYVSEDELDRVMDIINSMNAEIEKVVSS
ncbi:hypothetical protein [Gracilibacillus sp. YIM 98692]|uniref:hypothetical protein n=1 Tax=Gracilibacillus sp. YIM 98692 TaxID=2663532 RepID=UPI0013D7CC92|nr:hypothetical protein [Gracilibacillus sp. YIM 98692]